jgi:AcrR family transcriptional regulator
LSRAFTDGGFTDTEGERVPTGVALRDAREQLFAAAERILLRDGPGGLTSRAVTEEAGVAKGVLHRHFADFDDFLAGLVRDRAARVRAQAAALLESAGTGTVAGNVTAALTEVFGSVAGEILTLIIFRDGLRARLRETWPRGIPLTMEAVAMIRDYLAAEQDLGRVAAGADIPALAPMLIGAAHLAFADRDGGPPDDAEFRAAVAAAIPADVPGRPAACEPPRDANSGLLRHARAYDGLGTACRPVTARALIWFIGTATVSGTRMIGTRPMTPAMMR